MSEFLQQRLTVTTALRLHLESLRERDMFELRLIENMCDETGFSKLRASVARVRGSYNDAIKAVEAAELRLKKMLDNPRDKG